MFVEVGIDHCMEHVGPHVPHAEMPRATSSRRVLALSDLIPLTQEEQMLADTRELWETLCAPWPDSSMHDDPVLLDFLPDLDPQCRTFLKSIPRWKDEKICKVNIFVNGSSYSNRPEPSDAVAAWAFVVMYEVEDSQMPFHYRGVVYRHLSSANEPSESFLGIGEFCHDSLSAEAVAMVWTLTWILQSGLIHEFEVFYDNCTIGQFMSGHAQWKCTWEYIRLKTVLSAIRSCLHVAKIPVTFSHVKSHSGLPWNEMVDSVAKTTAKRILPVPFLPAQVAKALRHPRLGYMWMELANSYAIPRPIALKATFGCEGPFPDRIEDTTWNYPIASKVQEAVTIHLQFGTINVLTLDPGAKSAQQKGLIQQGRITSLQGQLSEFTIHLIGLQECRTQNALTRHSATHLVFQSGATASGTHGYKLWVDRRAPYARNHKQQFHFQPEHFHIAHADPRCLYAEVNAPHLRLRVLVMHAPHQAAVNPDFQEWWNEMSCIIARGPTGSPLVVLADTNSQIGNISSDAISNH